MRGFRKLLEVHITWLLRCSSEIMDRKLIYGVLELSFIFCCVGFLHFGLVSMYFDLYIFLSFFMESMAAIFYYCFLYLFFHWPKVCFHAESEQGVAQAILRGLIDFKRDPWPNISESAKSLVRQMLEPDPKLRLTAKQVLGSLHIFCTIFGW